MKGCKSKRISDRLREVIVPLHSALVRILIWKNVPSFGLPGAKKASASPLEGKEDGQELGESEGAYSASRRKR